MSQDKETEGKDQACKGDLVESTAPVVQTVFVMRHGARLDCADLTWYKTAARPYDTPITGAGREEAHMVAKSRCTGRKISKVITSPFLRCLQTGQEVCRALSFPGVTTCNGLSEIMCSSADLWQPPEVPAWDDVEKFQVTVVQTDPLPMPKYPESLQQSLNRYSRVIPEIADQHWPENLVLVTHQYGVEQALALALGRRNAADYEVTYCGNVEMTRTGKHDPWLLVSTDRIFQYETFFD